MRWVVQESEQQGPNRSQTDSYHKPLPAPSARLNGRGLNARPAESPEGLREAAGSACAAWFLAPLAAAGLLAGLAESCAAPPAWTTWQKAFFLGIIGTNHLPKRPDTSAKGHTDTSLLHHSRRICLQARRGWLEARGARLETRGARLEARRAKG